MGVHRAAGGGEAGAAGHQPGVVDVYRVPAAGPGGGSSDYFRSLVLPTRFGEVAASTIWAARRDGGLGLEAREL